MTKSITTVDELEKFVSSSRPGEACIYHEGMLILDREFDPAVHRLAARACELAENNVVDLFQRRYGFHHYEYMAVRRAA